MTPKRIALYQTYLTRGIAALAGVCAFSVFLYIVFLMLAVEHTASRTAMQEKIDALTLELSNLETQYLSDTKTFTPEYAAAQGFVQPTSVTAVFADAGSHALSFK